MLAVAVCGSPQPTTISSVPSPVKSPKNTRSTSVEVEVNCASERHAPASSSAMNWSRMPPVSPAAQKPTTSETPSPSRSREMIAER